MMVVDGAVVCWMGMSSSEENFRGRFLVRDNDVRPDGGVGDVCGAVVGSFIADAEDKTGNVVKECSLLGTEAGEIL